MLHKYYKDGEKLDVAGLNQINVLVDRSNTELTEVGLNEWRAGLEGPPHTHHGKEQIFYITQGEGKIVVGSNSYTVKPGELIYIPAGVEHQTISKGKKSLIYVLYNVFTDPEKEGHKSFKDHINKVKKIRRKQADSKNSLDEKITELSHEVKSPKYISDVFKGKENDEGDKSKIILLDRNETNNFEFETVKLQEEDGVTEITFKKKEQTCFVLGGTGKVTIGNESEEIVPKDIFFIPRNVPHSIKAKKDTLLYLSLNTYINNKEINN